MSWSNMLQCQHTGAYTGCNVKTRGFNISKITVSVVALSDHAYVFFHVNAPVHKDANIEVISKWYINEMTRELFSHTISSLPPLCSGTVNKLVDEFSFRITDVLECIHQVTVKKDSSEFLHGETNLDIRYQILKRGFLTWNLKNARQCFFL